MGPGDEATGGGGQAVSQRDKTVKVVQEPGVEQDSIQNEYPLYCLSDVGHSKPIKVEVVVDRNPLTMELDTGAAVSLVSESTYRYCHTACLMEQRSRSRLLLGRSQILKGVIPKLRKKPLLLYLE